MLPRAMPRDYLKLDEAYDGDLYLEYYEESIVGRY